MPVIAVSNQKGGVGKTTTTVNLGAALLEAGKRVLLVDLDPQGNLSVAAGLSDVESVSPSIGDLLVASAHGRGGRVPTVQQAIVRSPSGLDVVPANASLSAAELSLVSAMNREATLASILRPVLDQYDYILIDCLPSLGLLAINALRASDGVVIPVQADFLAMQGLAQIIETIAAVREQLNPGLGIYGVLLTMVDQRTAHARDVVGTVRSSLDGQVHVFQTEVRLHVVLKETAKAGRSILDFDSQSPAAESYRALARELIVRTDSLAREAHPAVTPEVASPSAPSDKAPTHRPVASEPPAVPVPTPAPASIAVAEAPGPNRSSTATAPGPPVAEPVAAARAAAPVPLGFEQFLEGRERWLGSVGR